MGVLGNTAAATQRCAYCGKNMAPHLTRCPFCREDVPQVRLTSRSASNGNSQIRRGLLYMLMGAVIHYFAGGYGAPIFTIPLPAPVMPILTQYLTPLLFLGGLGFAIYGIFLKLRS
jgi:hypothetical protein